MYILSAVAKNRQNVFYPRNSNAVVNKATNSGSSIQYSSPGESDGMGKARLVEQVCDYIRENVSSSLTLEDLEKKFSVRGYTIQRWFKDIMGISPRKYMEELRIHKLKNNLKNGEPMPMAIYNTGYRSQSWLYEDSLSKLGMVPSAYRKGGAGETIYFLTGICTLGAIIVAETEQGICAVSMGDSEEALEQSLKKEFNKADLQRSEKARKRLDSLLEYFNGQRLTLPVALQGTDFQQRVWAAIASIPYGETRSYNEIAEMIGKPKSFRAVANACGANHVPLVIPCHRVVRKDGSLGGYALGLDRKKYLLEMEKKNSSNR